MRVSARVHRVLVASSNAGNGEGIEKSFSFLIIILVRSVGSGAGAQRGGNNYETERTKTIGQGRIDAPRIEFERGNRCVEVERVVPNALLDSRSPETR